MGCGHIQSLWKLRKLSGRLEKAPGLSQAQANIVPGEQTISLSLSLSHSLIYSLSLSEPLWEPALPQCSHTSSLHSHEASTRRLQQGACTPQHSNGLQPETHADLARSWPGLDFNMEQKLWAVAFIPAPLKTGLDFFHGKMDRDRTLGSQEGNPLNFHRQ